MDGNGIKLMLMVFLGFLFIEIGLTGQLGSMLGAIITPSYMVAASPGTARGTTEYIFGGANTNG